MDEKIINKNEFIKIFKIFDKSILFEMIDSFIRDHNKNILKIKRDIEKKDIDSLRFGTHNLKSQVSNFCAPKLLNILIKLELKAKNSDLKDITDLYNKVHLLLEQFVAELEEIKGSY